MSDPVKVFGRRVLSRHGTVVAYLALVLASSGVAYAAATIDSADVINNSLKSADLMDGLAVKGADVVNDSLTGADVQEATLRGVTRTISLQGHGQTAAVGPWTVGLECSDLFSDGSVSQAVARVQGPGWAHYWVVYTTDDEGERLDAGTVGLSPNFPTPVVSHIGGDGVGKIRGTMLLQSGAELARVDMLVTAWNGTPFCTLVGTGTHGT